MKITKKLLTITLALGLGLAVPLAHANLITNGSFETPVVSAYASFSTGGSFAGWSVVGAQGSVAIVSGAYTQDGFSFVSQAGAQWLDLTGISSNKATGVQQVVATIPGATYDLSFYVGNVYDPTNSADYGLFGTTSTVNLLINGSPVLAATNTQGAGSTTQIWQLFTTSFTDTGASTTLAFIKGDPSTDNNNGLDNIALTAVPIPAAVWLLGSGLLGLVGVARRRG